jgi:uncharacterized protein YceK
MKKIAIILVVLVLTGCATTQYKSPDGTEITYTRFATTADSIKAEAGNAKVESSGQKIDTKTLTAIIEFLKTIQ